MEPRYHRRIVKTMDGSHTLELVGMDEHYHSTFGAAQESMHVFIRNGLHFLKGNNEVVYVLEIGFGTGLNALLTLLESQKMKLQVYYFTLEPFPLEHEEFEALNYPSLLAEPGLLEVFLRFHESEWSKDMELVPGFVFRKEKTDLETVSLPGHIFDLVYYDAFGPDTQPELWEQPLFEKVYKTMKPGGILTTYCAKGIVRRAMKASGFHVENLPGPPGKREMTKAVKVGR
jgi:tRNA U34 5-methylaminomethyl-2-thiouridine-forming methyltransferase MnmC